MTCHQVGPNATVVVTKVIEVPSDKQPVKSRLCEIVKQIVADSKALSPKEEQEVLSAFVQKDKIAFLSSWWNCWAGWCDPEHLDARDLWRPPPPPVLLSNVALLKKHLSFVLKLLPTFTPDKVKNIVSFLEELKQYSPTLATAMKTITPLADCDEKSATRAGREIHRTLHDVREKLLSEMPSDVLQKIEWKKEVPQAIAERLGISIATF